MLNYYSVRFTVFSEIRGFTSCPFSVLGPVSRCLFLTPSGHLCSRMGQFFQLPLGSRVLGPRASLTTSQRLHKARLRQNPARMPTWNRSTRHTEGARCISETRRETHVRNCHGRSPALQTRRPGSVHLDLLVFLGFILKRWCTSSKAALSAVTPMEDSR